MSVKAGQDQAELRVARPGPGRPRTRPDLARRQGLFFARPPRAPVRTADHRSHPRARRPDRARKNRGSHGGRPVTFDAPDYKNRNVIERAFNQFKNSRGIAPRYDKHALVYRSGVVLASILLWLS